MHIGLPFFWICCSHLLSFDWRNDHQPDPLTPQKWWRNQLWAVIPRSGTKFIICHSQWRCDGLTCIFGPLQDRRDLIALLRFADAVTSCRANADGVQVGFHSAKKRRGRGCAVWNLEVHTIGLQVTHTKHTQLLNILEYSVGKRSSPLFPKCSQQKVMTTRYCKMSKLPKMDRET